jgi:hypothetical protein
LEKGVRLPAINWQHPVWDPSKLLWGILAERKQLVLGLEKRKRGVPVEV